MNEAALLTKRVAEHAAALRLYACQLLADPSDADDVVQNALVSLLTASATTSPDNPVAWMYRVVRNAAMDYRRSSDRRRRRERRVADARREWFAPASTDGLIESDAAQHALSHLDAEDREIVVLRIWGGLPFAEIAAIVRHSASTVHARYESALMRMRTALLEKSCHMTIT